MTGTGMSHGAGTVVNAMATGRGAAFGLDFRIEATVAEATDYTVLASGRRLGPEDARLALECVRLVEQQAGERAPVRVDTKGDLPSARGLKSSSAAAIAILRAAAAHHGLAPEVEQILDWAAEAGLRSGTSRTGAYDDAAACLLGGLVLTDNTKRRVLERRAMPDGLVALVRIPDAQNPTSKFRTTDLEGVRGKAEEAFGRAEAGDVPAAMRINTLAYAPVFGVDVSFSQAAWDAGAWAAGLSGTGPAQIALVDEKRVGEFEALHADRRVALFGGEEE